MMNNNILPYFRKDTSSTLLTLSAAIAMLLLASPLLPLSNLLLQPVQAQTTTMTFMTPRPAHGRDGSSLTFDAQGTLSINPRSYQPMNGTIQITSSDGGIIASGDIVRGRLSNNSNGELTIEMMSNHGDIILAPCSTSADNNFIADDAYYQGAVECDIGGDTTAAQPSSSSPTTGTTTTSQDSDGDGIPDSSDRCDHNSNHRCYKESK